MCIFCGMYWQFDMVYNETSIVYFIYNFFVHDPVIA